VPTGTIGKINKGAASLALKLEAPIYLVTHNAGAFWPKNSLIRKPGVIKVKVSPALNPQGMTVEQINQAVFEWYDQH
jgi:1-acyl-sn-glycerol-3-phosphate acyltransferase